MRKLTYDIYENGTLIKNVATYKEAKDAKEKGYTVSYVMKDIKEKLVYDCYKNNKLVKTVVLNKDRAKAKKDGFEIKARYQYSIA